MKQLKQYAIAMSLMLALNHSVYAKHGDHDLSIDSRTETPEMQTIASNYFDANWTLVTDSGKTQPVMDAKIAGIVNDYLDANWKVFAGSGETKTQSGNELTKIANDYFDANWRINKAPLSIMAVKVGAVDTKIAGIANDYLDANWKVFAASGEINVDSGEPYLLVLHLLMNSNPKP